jgi:hypothetical protein
MQEPAHVLLADRVKTLCDQGLLMAEIAEQLGCSKNTLTKAFRHWYSSRGETPPDGRGRRKTLQLNSAPDGWLRRVLKPDSAMLLKSRAMLVIQVRRRASFFLRLSIGKKGFVVPGRVP